MLSSKPIFEADCEITVAGSCLGSPTCFVWRHIDVQYLSYWKSSTIRKMKVFRMSLNLLALSICRVEGTLLTITHLAWVCFRSWSGISVAGSRAYRKECKAKLKQTRIFGITEWILAIQPEIAAFYAWPTIL